MTDTACHSPGVLRRILQGSSKNFPVLRNSITELSSFHLALKGVEERKGLLTRVRAPRTLSRNRSHSNINISLLASGSDCTTASFRIRLCADSMVSMHHSRMIIRSTPWKMKRKIQVHLVHRLTNLITVATQP